MTNKDINSFCKRHALGFFALSTIQVSQNLIMFRQFLTAILPIKLTVIDGQHRVEAVHFVQELRLVFQAIPCMFAKAEPGMKPPFSKKPEERNPISEM